MFEEERPRAKSAITPGEDLSEFSVEGLKERVEALRAEIARAEAMIASKSSHAEAAAAFFSTPSGD
jgi:uncharacterized small protein (DUF1192 family)